VLVVDDEDAIRDVGERILRQAGYQVFVAKHGEDALEILERQQNANTPVTLVLTDIMMPVMGGRELADLIVTEYPDTRVLCMSGYTRDELLRQYLVHEAVSIVHKPFEVHELVTAVKTALDTTQIAHTT
jgi:CheY-like chemotaxis protein